MTLVLPKKPVIGDRVRIKDEFVRKMLPLYPSLSKDDVFEVTGESGAYEKRTLVVKGPREGLPTMVYAGTTKRAWEAGEDREKALRAAGATW